MERLRRVMLAWPGLSRFACRHPRKSCGYKWGYDSCPFFVWRFLAQGTSDKEQMTQFLPTRIFSVSVLSYDCCVARLGLHASPSGVQMDIPGVEEDRTGCERVARGSKWQPGAKLGTRVASCCAARDVPARGPTLKRAARPFSLISSFFLSFFSLDPTSSLLLFYSYLAIRDSD